MTIIEIYYNDMRYRNDHIRVLCNDNETNDEVTIYEMTVLWWYIDWYVNDCMEWKVKYDKQWSLVRRKLWWNYSPIWPMNNEEAIVWSEAERWNYWWAEGEIMSLLLCEYMIVIQWPMMIWRKALLCISDC